MRLITLVVVAVALIAPHSPALEQSRRRSESRSSADAKRAEELFREALLLSVTRERASARQRLQEAMRLWMSAREPEKAASAALQIGDRYKQAGRYHASLDHYGLALRVTSIPGALRAKASNAIALVYRELYLDELAIHYFKKSLDQSRRINDLPAQASALADLASLHYRQANREQALKCIAQAQRLDRRRGADANPTLLYLMGQIREEEGSVDQAKAAFEDALAIYKKAGDREGQIKMLCTISNLYLLSSQKQAALGHAEQAVELAEAQAKRAVGHAGKSRARQLRWRVWLSRARAERAVGQKEDAIKSYYRATYNIEAINWAIYTATEASAIAFREDTQAAYRELADLLIEQEQFKGAFELAERAKARTILNLIAARQATDDRAATIRELSQDIARLPVQLLDSAANPKQQAKRQKEDAELEMTEKQAQSEMENMRSRLVWSNPATAEQMQKQSAQDQTALAEFLLGENRSFVWLFTGGKCFFEILPGRREIEKAVRSYLALLASAPDDMQIEKGLAEVKKQAESLFDILFGRLSSHLDAGRRLIIVPDGLLHYLPFEAIVHNGRFLIEDHEISYTPSASMLGLWKDAASDGDDRMELFGVGDPVFESGAKNKMARQSLAARGFHLGRLPGTQAEIKSLADLFPPDRRKTLLGSESTEEAVKLESLRRYRRLHFATHSLIDEKSPSRSALALTPGDQSEEDGFLEASEISSLDLDCDLVVLSACQTARGRLLSGEGTLGLSRAFLLAGARSVVVSLWNISDVSTRRLMQNFYRLMIAGSSNAAALRKAKLQMLDSRQETRHPHYWSSFVMIGKP